MTKNDQQIGRRVQIVESKARYPLPDLNLIGRTGLKANWKTGPDKHTTHWLVESDGTPTSVGIPTWVWGENLKPLNEADPHAKGRPTAKSVSKTLLRAFENQVSAFPRTTEAERLVVQRVGQSLFRDGLLKMWECRCAVTGLAIPELLRASHIKPWADCGSDAERLDVENGLLLAPHLDVAFDQGFVTVADDGAILVSESLDSDALAALGLNRPLRVRGLADGHRNYLPWHRERIFRAHRSATKSGKLQ